MMLRRLPNRLALGPSLAAMIAIAGCSQGGAAPSGSASATGSASAAGAARACEPGASEPCWSGPAAARGVGACKAGSRVCNAAGTEWSACEGQVLPRFDDCASPEDEDCDGKAAVCTGDELWSQRFVSGAEARVSAVKVAPDGSIRIGGIVKGGITFHEGMRQESDSRDIDGFVARVDPDGGVRSVHLLGGPEEQRVHDIDVDASGGLFVGGSYFGGVKVDGAAAVTDEKAFQNQGFLLRLDPSDKLDFAHSRSKDIGHATRVRRVRAKQGGGVWFAERDGLAHLDARGNSLPHMPLREKGWAIATTAEGNLLAIESDPDKTTSLFAFDAAGTKLWSRPLGEHMYIDHVATGPDRIYITGIAGFPTGVAGLPFNPKRPYGFFVALDGKGNALYLKQLTAWGSFDEEDLWLIPWWKTGIRSKWDNGVLIGSDPAGHPVIVSPFLAGIEFEDRKLLTKLPRDVAIIKLHRDTGAIMYARALGGPAGRFPHAISVDAKGRVIVGGAYVDHADAWLAAFAP